VRSTRAAFAAGALACVAAFGAGYLLRGRLAPTSRGEGAVVLAPEVRAALEEERTEALGRALTDAERRTLADEWLAQEILVREAYRRGLDQGDGVVRHRLIEKMRTLLREPPREPTRAELEAFHRTHADRYTAPERATVQHVFAFATGPARAELPTHLAVLRAGADFRGRGDRFWLGPELVNVTRAELVRTFGDAFAATVFDLPVGLWSGPHASTRGLHLVRLVERRPPEAAPYEAVANAVRDDWFEAREREALERQVAELAKGYEIVKP
jgi:hypothetical protein